jgi:hypothetical protein
MKFNEWVGKSPDVVFGFDKGIIQKNQLLYAEEPIEPLQIETTLDEIINLGKIGIKEPIKDFGSMVTYGDPKQVGSIQIKFSPLGSCRATIMRRISDLEGELTWITRYSIPVINDYEHITQEDIAAEKMLAIRAHELADYLDKTSLESPKSKFEKLQDLVVLIAANMKLRHPKVMNYQGTMRQNDNTYIIYFNYNGFGIEAPSQRKVNQFNVYVEFIPHRGLVRCWGAEYSAPHLLYNYDAQPPEWDEYFSPDQNKNEIVTVLENIFKTY